jgi:hypothetical protein
MPAWSRSVNLWERVTATSQRMKRGAVSIAIETITWHIMPWCARYAQDGCNSKRADGKDSLLDVFDGLG